MTTMCGFLNSPHVHPVQTHIVYLKGSKWRESKKRFTFNFSFLCVLNIHTYVHYITWDGNLKCKQKLVEDLSPHISSSIGVKAGNGVVTNFYILFNMSQNVTHDMTNSSPPGCTFSLRREKAISCWEQNSEDISRFHLLNSIFCVLCATNTGFTNAINKQVVSRFSRSLKKRDYLSRWYPKYTQIAPHIFSPWEKHRYTPFIVVLASHNNFQA